MRAGMVAGKSSENDPRMRVLHLTRDGRRLQRVRPSGTARSASPMPPPAGPATTSPSSPTCSTASPALSTDRGRVRLDGQLKQLTPYGRALRRLYLER